LNAGRISAIIREMKKLLIIGVVAAAMGMVVGCASMKKCWRKTFPSHHVNKPAETKLKWAPGHF
jgi:hypothetical protein